MDLAFSDAEEAFRKEVQQFLKDEWFDADGKVQYSMEVKEDWVAWGQKLNKQGWVAPSWPQEVGGTNWTPTQHYIFDEEMAKAGAFPGLTFNIAMVGPVIYTFGNEEQKKRFLPDTLNHDIWWCQGYSEPGSGSDLASLKTKAVREGDHYIVNGSKTWTTLAQHADWIFCLVRTNSDVKKQQGISFILIDMKSPGVTVRPIITLGGDHEVNEVFLDNVKVPAENLIGEENMGWTYAKFLLMHERSSIAQVHASRKRLNRLKELASDKEIHGEYLPLEEPEFRRKVTDLEISIKALEFTELRAIANMSAGKGPGPEASILKIRGTEIQQGISHLAVDLSGYFSMPFQRDLGDNQQAAGPDHTVDAAATYFNVRKTSIYGGSNEIQRNIIAKAVLGL